jgi:rhodanese-related sulfurtransferase
MQMFSGRVPDSGTGARPAREWPAPEWPGQRTRRIADNATESTRGDVRSMADNTQNQQDYAGDITPRQAWDLLAQERAAILVDVRSRPEWSFVGVPDLSSLGKKPLLVAWQHWTPNTQGAVMAPNTAFAEELAAVAPAKDAPVIFLCRSGARSRAAAIAMTKLGYARAFNLAGGFEGAHDSSRHRGSIDGWKAAGLPWMQD